jgi:hypothetical protein
MDAQEVNRVLTWLNQHDARIHNTTPAVEIWTASIGAYATYEVKAAILDHYRLNEDDEKATPGGIRRIAAGNRERAQAASNALTAAPSRPDLTEPQLRRRIFDTPAFRAAFDRGVIEGSAERAYNTTLRATGDHHAAAQAAQTVRSTK